MQPPDEPSDDAAELAEVTARYRLSFGSQRYRGRAGGRRGHGVGSSQEFFDFRDYTPGDDLRYLDWRGYARSEQLRIRLHQEEVAPFVDVLVDTSASLASTPRKERAARGLAAALRRWAQQEGAAVRLLELGGGPQALESLAFARTEDVPAPPAVALRPGGVRVLLTDGLWSGDAAPVVQRLLAGAARFLCVQLLDPWELEPTADGALTLVDCETGERREVHLDSRAIAAYRERLDRLEEALRAVVLAGGGSHVLATADTLPAMCRRHLLPAGILEPA